MPRYAARADRNQAEIVQAVRDLGGEVEHLHTVGRGCPDVLVAFKGRWLPVEIKSKRGKLTPAEREWHDRMGRHAPTYVWRCRDDVVKELLGVEYA